jgi:hypothetical protein
MEYPAPDTPAAGADAALVLIEPKGSDDEEAPTPPPAYHVLNRARLDHAMGVMEEAITLPASRRYQSAMLEERLAILGEPERMVQMIERTALSVALILPSLGQQRDVARAAVAYGDLLLREGDTERAAVFLTAWQPMSRHLLDGCTTLIEILVAGAIVKEGETAAAAYARAGMPAEAERMLARVDAAYGPVERWNAARRGAGSRALDEALETRGGVLASILVPALGESIPDGALDPSRRLEYTVATEGLVGMATLALFSAMFGCLLVALRWRFGRRGRVIPLLLFPRLNELAWVLGLGVLLPGTVFLLVTRGLPMSGHAYSVRVAMHRLVAEFGLLVMALAVLPAWLGTRVVRRRCAELQIPTTRLAARFGVALVLLAAIAFAVLWWMPRDHTAPATVGAWIAAGVGAVGMLAVVFATLWQGFGTSYGLFLGTLHRSLIPILAAAVVALSLVSRPVLIGSEAAYLRQDTMFISDGVGFTALEDQLTGRLCSEMLTALDALDAGR